MRFLTLGLASVLVALAADAPMVRVDSALVLVNASVTDEMGRFVADLDQRHFRLFEDRVEQTILSVAREEAPVSIGIVFDSSSSIVDSLNRLRWAVAEFCRNANPDDEFFLVQFSSRPVLANGWGSCEGLLAKLATTEAHGRTALFDAVALALHQMKTASHRRRALLVLSDGEENSSRLSESELRNMLVEANVEIHALQFGQPNLAQQLSGGHATRPDSLRQMAAQTGGRFVPVDDLRKLAQAASRLSVELHNQYLLSYRPTTNRLDGKYRRIRVRVEPADGRPRLRVYSRPGYYAIPQ